MVLEIECLKIIYIRIEEGCYKSHKCDGIGFSKSAEAIINSICINYEDHFILKKAY